MTDPKTDCEMLLGALMPFAEQMLAEHGEFYPFAASMSPLGECRMEAIADDIDDDDHPRPAELIEKFVEQFRSRSQSGEFKATAIVYDSLTVPPGKSEKQDTVICAVDHQDNFSAKICFPYAIADGKVGMEDPYAAAGDNRIFSANKQ